MNVDIGKIQVSNKSPLLLIAGPCVIESQALAEEVAGHLQEITQKLDIPFIYKSSFDKANRTSLKSYRGPGIEEGLKILDRIKNNMNILLRSFGKQPFTWSYPK